MVTSAISTKHPLRVHFRDKEMVSTKDMKTAKVNLFLVSFLFQNSETISQVAHEQIIVLLAPLLENNHPTQEICDFFSKVSESNLMME